jgi:hypothetical protein
MKNKIIRGAFLVLFVAGCQRPPTVPTTFASGPVERVELPSGFVAKSSLPSPWTLLAEHASGRSFSLQVLLPKDEAWKDAGNLADAAGALGDNAYRVTVNHRKWVIVPFNGVLAYSLETDVRMYFLGQGRWDTRATVQVLEGIHLRSKKE